MIRIALFLLLCASVLWSMPAKASSDVVCSASRKLRFAVYSGCVDTAMIGPRNDSRTNLILLMADLPGAARARGPAKPSIFLDAASLAPPSEQQDSLFSMAKGRAAEATRPAPPISKPPCVPMPRCPSRNALH